MLFVLQNLSILVSIEWATGTTTKANIYTPDITLLYHQHSISCLLDIIVTTLGPLLGGLFPGTPGAHLCRLKQVPHFWYWVYCRRILYYSRQTNKLVLCNKTIFTMRGNKLAPRILQHFQNGQQTKVCVVVFGLLFAVVLLSSWGGYSVVGAQQQHKFNFILQIIHFSCTRRRVEQISGRLVCLQ